MAFPWGSNTPLFRETKILTRMVRCFQPPAYPFNEKPGGR
jgi:hypothetical protein